MTRPIFRLALVLCTAIFAPLTLPAQTSTPSAEQLKSWIEIRQQRVDLLRDEIKQSDSRIESRLDVIIDTLKRITDSKDSQTKVARMKEDTSKQLMKTINSYDQRRSALRQELRIPRLQLTAEEKRKMIDIFDARIEKRAHQILSLYKSMPEHKDYDRYKYSGNEWTGGAYYQNSDYEHNRKMTSHANMQRDAIMKQLDASIERLDRQARALKTQQAATPDPLQRKTLTDELTKTDNLIAERRKQRLETLKPSGSATHKVALNQAMDMDKALQSATTELRRDFTTLFQRYNTFLNELSSLHATEATLAAKSVH